MLAVQGVVTVATTQGVVARTAIQGVVTAISQHRIIAIAAIEIVVPFGTRQGAVAIAFDIIIARAAKKDILAATTPYLVVAVATFDVVGAIRGVAVCVAHEVIVPGLAQEDIVAALAKHHVIAAARIHVVVAALGEHPVIARSGVDNVVTFLRYYAKPDVVVLACPGRIIRIPRNRSRHAPVDSRASEPLIPFDGVVPGAGEDDVIASPAGQQVVARASIHLVQANTAAQQVAPRARARPGLAGQVHRAGRLLLVRVKKVVAWAAEQDVAIRPAFQQVAIRFKELIGKRHGDIIPVGKISHYYVVPGPTVDMVMVDKAEKIIS